MSGKELFYVVLGLASIGVTIWPNRQLYARGNAAGGASGAEWTYYAMALLALLIGWYFNFQYMRGYGDEATWANWCKLLFANPAAASGGQDLIIANVLVMPLWCVLEGRRSGLRHGWLFFVMSIVTSYAFGIALFLAVQERQWRTRKAS
jgi:hypothetical protein